MNLNYNRFIISIPRLIKLKSQLLTATVLKDSATFKHKFLFRKYAGIWIIIRDYYKINYYVQHNKLISAFTKITNFPLPYFVNNAYNNEQPQYIYIYIHNYPLRRNPFPFTRRRSLTESSTHTFCKLRRSSSSAAQKKKQRVEVNYTSAARRGSY